MHVYVLNVAKEVHPVWQNPEEMWPAGLQVGSVSLGASPTPPPTSPPLLASPPPPASPPPEPVPVPAPKSGGSSSTAGVVGGVVGGIVAAIIVAGLDHYSHNMLMMMLQSPNASVFGPPSGVANAWM